MMEVRARHIAYFLPCKPGTVYVNITNNCLNECLFCIKRGGTSFFGTDLALTGGGPPAEEVIESFRSVEKGVKSTVDGFVLFRETMGVAP